VKLRLPAVPILLLALACLSLLVLQNHENGFEWGARGHLSSHAMALAKNLWTGDHPFFMFAQRSLEGGQIHYDAYNRFPLLPFVLIGLAARFFEPHLAAQILAGRILMDLFLIAAMVVTFLLLRRLSRDPDRAAALTLLAFSSYYLLFFGDMIFNDNPALLGFVLALYAVAAGEAGPLRRRSLLLYAFVPMALGWQPFAVFGTWAALDLGTALFARGGPSRRERLLDLARRPSIRIAALALAWTVATLGAQLLNEWRIVGGAFAALPSVRSMLWRTGVAGGNIMPPNAMGTPAEYAASLGWGGFLCEQCRRLVIMITPGASVLEVGLELRSAWSVPLALAAAAALYLAARRREGNLLSPRLALVFACSGLVWGIGMRYFTAFHAFQAIYNLGFTLALFLLLSLYADARIWRTAAVLSTVLFVVCVARINQGKAGVAQNVNVITDEFQQIYDRLPRNSKVYVDGDRHAIGLGYHAVDFYLAGSISAPLDQADYVVSTNPAWGGRRLTANAKVNLFKAGRP
jgi:hypothetical protein